MTNPTQTITNAGVNDLVAALRARHDARRDFVVSPNKLRVPINQHAVEFTSTVEGVDLESTSTWPLNDHASGQLADRLDIPRNYWKKMRGTPMASMLLSQNANYWLMNGGPQGILMRGLEWFDEDAEQVQRMCRAIVSDRYNVIDDYDVLMSVIQGCRDSGVEVSGRHLTGSITETKCHIRIVVPEIAAHAGDLAERYNRNGRSGRDYPLVNAGLVVNNSEVGGGAFTISPYLVWQVCTNGMTRTQDQVRQIHLGGRKDEGQIVWSADTTRKMLDVIAAKTRDAVNEFVSVEFVERVLDELRGANEITLKRPDEVLKEVTKKLTYTEAEQQAILDEFFAGGDLSPLGVGQAITAHAQTVRESDPDRAAQMEEHFFSAVSMAAAHTA